MKVHLPLLLLVCFIANSTLIWGQSRRFTPKQRFHLGLIAGVNAAQMDGDDFRGYDKFGVMGGIQGIALLNKRMELNVELLFSQKGAKIGYRGVYDDLERQLQLNYASVPVLLCFEPLFSEDENPTFSKIGLEIGVAFSRLLAFSLEENVDLALLPLTDAAPDFQRNDIDAILGLSFPLWRNFNLGIRSAFAVTKFYENSNYDEEARTKSITESYPYRFFRNYHLSLFLTYQVY